MLDKMTRVCFRLMFPDKQVTISILEKKIHSLWGAHSWSRGKSAKVGVEKERCKIHPRDTFSRDIGPKIDHLRVIHIGCDEDLLYYLSCPIVKSLT